MLQQSQYKSYFFYQNIILIQEMFNDRDPLECLNLSVNYVSHWTYLQGLRELYQNFMDACIEVHPEYKMLRRHQQAANKIVFKQARRVGNKLEEVEANFISYDKIKKTLILENDKCFSIKCLLMGCSVKGTEALGQFGEGMKVAMIVLLKAGIDIVIESGENTYYPTIKSWDHNEMFTGKYDTNVLYVKIQSKKFQDKTRVIIDNIDAAKFEEFIYLSLALLEENKYQAITCGNSTLIIPNDPKLVGKIYKKGVRLQLHESANSQKFQHYSYNFEQIQVGRERDCVNNVWDLYRLQSKLHFDVSCLFLNTDYLIKNPHMKPKLRQHSYNIYNFTKVNNHATQFYHQYSLNNKQVCDILYQRFLQDHTAVQLYPQYDSVRGNIARSLILYGLESKFYPCVNVSWESWHTLIYSNKYKSIQQKIEDQIVNKQARQFTGDESTLIQQIRTKIAVILPEIKNYGFKVKAFKDIVCCKDKNNEIKVIYLNPEQINNADKMTRHLCKLLLL